MSTKFSSAAIQRRRNMGTQIGGIKGALKLERVNEMGGGFNMGNPMKQNPKLNHSAGRQPMFESPIGNGRLGGKFGAAIARRRKSMRNSVNGSTGLKYH